MSDDHGIQDTTVTWGTELSAFDYMMYRADQDPHTRTTVMQIETLDIVPDWDRLRHDVERASRVALRLRQKVVAPLVPLTAARWVVDEEFDLDYHLRRIKLPGPTTLRQVLDVAQTLYHDPLDPNRPLWEVVLVEGLEDDGAKAALIWKLSHATIDGVGGAIIDRLVRSDQRNPPAAPMPPAPAGEALSAIELTGRALRRLPLTIARRAVRDAGAAGRVMLKALGDPAGAAGEAARAAAAARRAVAGGSASSPLIKGRSLQRRFETYDVAFADLRSAARAHGFSLNDAYLAALAGAMRIYHDRCGVPIDTIGLGMPINVRSRRDPAGGNQWAAATLALPVAETDPVKRMAAIHQMVITARGDSSFNLMRILAPVVTWLPTQMLSGVGGGALGIDIQASNVPGSRVPRYIGGARILRPIAIGPLPGVALMATMVSAEGRLHLGLNVDAAAFTDAQLLRDSIAAGFAEVIDSTPQR